MTLKKLNAVLLVLLLFPFSVTQADTSFGEISSVDPVREIAEEGEGIEISRLLNAGQWSEAKTLIGKINESDKREFWMGIWFCSRENKDYNPIVGVAHFERSAKLGRMEAKIALVEAYLTAKDVRIVNYRQAVKYAEETFPYLKK